MTLDSLPQVDVEAFVATGSLSLEGGSIVLSGTDLSVKRAAKAEFVSPLGK